MNFWKRILMVGAVVWTVALGAGWLSPTAASLDQETVAPESASEEEEGESCGIFLGFRAWYEGIGCDTETINEFFTDKKNDSIPTFITAIVLNVLVDVSVLVGYIMLAMIIWGGYLYMFSNGQPLKVEKAKKTLIMAVVGFMVAVLADVVMSFVVQVVLGT